MWHRFFPRFPVFQPGAMGRIISHSNYRQPFPIKRSATAPDNWCVGTGRAFDQKILLLFLVSIWDFWRARSQTVFQPSFKSIWSYEGWQSIDLCQKELKQKSLSIVYLLACLFFWPLLQREHLTLLVFCLPPSFVWLYWEQRLWFLLFQLGFDFFTFPSYPSF